MGYLSCELDCLSSTEHLTHLYTGFGEWSRRGLVSAKVCRNKAYKPLGPQHLLVKLNSKIKIFYDLEDHDIINQKYLDASDLYFKRSFDSEEHPDISKKIFPLGLNFPVNGEYNFAFRRFLWDGQKVRKPIDLYRFLKFWGRRNATVIGNLEGYPQMDRNPQIVFYTKLWNPTNMNRLDLKEERFFINSMRASVFENSGRNTEQITLGACIRINTLWRISPIVQ